MTSVPKKHVSVHKPHLKSLTVSGSGSSFGCCLCLEPLESPPLYPNDSDRQGNANRGALSEQAAHVHSVLAGAETVRIGPPSDAVIPHRARFCPALLELIGELAFSSSSLDRKSTR